MVAARWQQGRPRLRRRDCTRARNSIGGWSACCRFLLLFTLLLGSFSASATAAEPLQRLLFIISKETSIYRQIVAAGESTLAEGGELLVWVAADGNARELRKRVADFAPTLVVTVGTAAAELTYQALLADDYRSVSPPLLSTLLTRSAFEVFSRRYIDAGQSATPVVVQLLDQPLERQLQLAELVVPSAQTIGVMVGPATLLPVSQFDLWSEQFAARVEPVYLSATDNPIRRLEPALAQSDVFVPLADSRQFNLATSRWILQLSYRYQRPIIGYSASYVEAGAVAAVYTSAEDVATELAQILQRWSVEGLPTASAQMAPEQFSISLNPAAAVALDIPLADVDFYRSELRKMIAGGDSELD